MGSLQIVVAPMFTGKTEQLIDACVVRLSREAPVFAAVPAIDSRSGPWFAAHNGRIHGPVAVLPVEQDWDQFVQEHKTGAERGGFFALDEIQFYANPLKLAWALRELADLGADILAAGLLRDADGCPWETTVAVLGVADHIYILSGTCACGNLATETRRRQEGHATRVQIGGSDLYEAVCRDCWRKSR